MASLKLSGASIALERSMESSPITRKLAAILAADVAGYTRLMGADEDGTMAAWWSHRKEVIDPKVAEYRGRIVKLTGDGFLAEFSSVLDALRCAVEMQRELARRNADHAADRRMDFRMGINLCDIMADDEDIYGDGVNIAARVEALAAPGGVCVTGSVRDQTRGNLEIAYEDMGERSLKNVAEPVRVYKVRMEDEGDPPATPGWTKPSRGWRRAALAAAGVLAVAGAVAVWWTPEVEVASRERMAFPLPEKPSIAVLPFDNLSGDAKQAYMADGLTEDLTTALAQVSNLFVIARNSTFAYKGKSVKVQRVAEDLGVRYVLEGSVQVSAGKVRINAQLIDALEGHHLWGERYDRQLQDLFALQDEITREIVTALQVKLTEGEQVRVWRRHTRDMEAWRHLTQGLEFFYRFTSRDNARARQLFEKSVEIDPQYALGHSLIAWTHWMDATEAWSASAQRSIGLATGLAQKALAFDDSLPGVYALLGGIHLFNRRYDQAVAAGERAVALSPNHATNNALLAMILHNDEQPQEAVRRITTAMRLSPYYPDWFLDILGFSYLEAGQTGVAIGAFQKLLQRRSTATYGDDDPHIGLAQAYAALGRDDEARAEVAKALAVNPKSCNRGKSPGDFSF